MYRKVFFATVASLALLPALTSCKKCITCTCNNYYDFTWDKNWDGIYSDEEKAAEEKKVITQLDIDYPETRKEDCGKKADLESLESEWVKADTTLEKDAAIFDYTMDHSCTCIWH